MNDNDDNFNVRESSYALFC